MPDAPETPVSSRSPPPPEDTFPEGTPVATSSHMNSGTADGDPDESQIGEGPPGGGEQPGTDLE